ncbi:hypothetical protein K9N50_07095 [bacterium]|nr:hypothetical protein [bacterium]
MIFAAFMAILGGFLFIGGCLPIRGGRYTFNMTSMSNLWARLSGLLILLGLFHNILPFDIPYGAIIFYTLGLIVLLIALIKELSAPIR